MYSIQDIEQVTYDYQKRIMTIKTKKKFLHKNYLKDQFLYKVDFYTYVEKFTKFIKYKTNTKTYACHIKNVPCAKFCESKEKWNCSLYLKRI